MSTKASLVLLGVLLVALLLVQSNVSDAATAAEKQQLTKGDAAVASEAMAAASADDQLVGDSKQRRVRCCWFYRGNCIQFCASNGNEIPADVAAKPEHGN